MKMRSATVRACSRRSLWLASAAGICFAVTGTANAQSTDIAGPEIAIEAPQGGIPTIAIDAPQGTTPTGVDDTPQIVVQGPGEGYTTAPGGENSIYDDAVDVTGVGQFYRADGFVCTGTLINPRTVLFAAHCVNDRPESDYGAATGGVPAAFSFKADALGGLISWIQAGYNSVPSDYVYNVNQIIWNSQSTERPEDLGFLQGDVAIASLDTPAANVPTWAILFSPLPAPDAIDSANGTGYHVTVNGYGVTGYGNGPLAAGVDFRRRAAENMIGILGSLSDRNNALFGTLLGFPGYPDSTYQQNLYQLDFDDPTRENPFDFNIFRDDARDPEGITAGGDSGGPLILDQTFDQKLVLGVLSGGSRYYNNQDFSTYGTSSFYQPLYLFWQWIAANSPYRYTASKAGDGNWMDPTHWVTTLDPNFMILENGQPVNGLPTTPQAGAFGTDDATKFGQVCNGAQCVDLTTGETVTYSTDGGPGVGTSNSNGAPAGDMTNNIARVDLQLTATDIATGGSITTGGYEKTAATAAAATLPDPTVDNGLPGATGYVPNNQDYDPVAGINSRYFDVTLAAAGKTTLDSTVTVDNLTLSGFDTALDITSDGSLTSLMGVTQYMGMVNVNGSLHTNGDYSLLTGLLSGSGTVNAPYFTSVMGVIAPGGMGTIGTLTFNGNVILASGTTYMADIGSNGVSDLIAVNATAYDQDQMPVDGIADIGGTVMFSPVAGSMVRDGNVYTILTAENQITGTFNSPASISAILKPELSYSDHAVKATIVAGSYADVINGSSPIQSAYARLLDNNRVQYGKYADLYGPLDLMSASAVQATLESFAPRSGPLLGAMGTAALDTNARFYRDRLSNIGNGTAGGTLAYYGKPLAVASVAVANPIIATSMVDTTAAQPDQVQAGVLPDDFSAFVAGGYINGNSAGAPTATPYARDRFDGFFLAGGIEKSIGTNGAAGIAFSYTDMTGRPGTPGRTSDGQLYQLTFYGGTTFANGITLDAQMSAGAFDTHATRALTAGTATYNLDARDTAFAFTAEVGVGKDIALSSAMKLTPRAAVRSSLIDFTPTAETGGGPALQYDLGAYKSVQGRFGLTLAGTGRGPVAPYATATYVHDFDSKPGSFGANFVGGVGPNAMFALPGTDHDYGEVGAGLTANVGAVSLSVVAETTVARSDVDYQSYRGSVTFHF